MVWTSRPVKQIAGTLRAPGDKSCSHRALILSGLASGTSEISGLLEGEDVLNTGRVMAALGAQVERVGDGAWRVEGVGKRGLQSPSTDLDFGNSGTGSRLMMGVVAGYPIRARFIGDASLSGRPMGRVLDPLSEMGVTYEASDGQRLPLTLQGRSDLNAISYTPPHASAQVKSCILLAGLNAEGTTTVTESRITRDHSERMLRGFGAEVKSQRQGAGNLVSIEGGQSLVAQETIVPGDPSSAAFLAAAAMISPRGGVVVEGMMSNETRDGFYRAAALMGAPVGAEDIGTAAGERLIDMSFESADLRGAAIPVDLVPSMIDEFPILAVLAAFASGKTVVKGAAELRVKESDRIKAVVAMLRVNGVAVEETEDGFIVEGCAGNVPGGGLVETHHDHRIAMSALIMGTAAQNPVSIDDAAMIATSYPDFMAHMAELGADISEGQP
ncbi:MAG: 3-phosphoshikimate 1-carboxyvinyltransferase [Hyphomonadaceae bacterium]|nr:3-phosphoshikimate 1-carboxyvinyltransferase [Hyphomonadaceae bacterium]